MMNAQLDVVNLAKHMMIRLNRYVGGHFLQDSLSTMVSWKCYPSQQISLPCSQYLMTCTSARKATMSSATVILTEIDEQFSIAFSHVLRHGQYARYIVVQNRILLLEQEMRQIGRPGIQLIPVHSVPYVPPTHHTRSIHMYQ